MLLFRNRHDGTFEEVSGPTGLAAMPSTSRRGTAFGDINNDGCIDIVVLNADEPPSLLLNHCSAANHRVLFDLRGTKSNRLAIGARVTVRCNQLEQFEEVESGSSYLSQNDLRLHFGFGPCANIDQVSIQWPGGKPEILRNVPTGFLFTLVEGNGIRNKAPLGR
jgi:hypothetical protein